MPELSRKGPSALLLCMMGIVACNVRFVQLTGAADPLWLAPLYVITLGAPFLLRFRDRLLYRGVWNVAIVLFFLRLVLHASTAELAFVLDDGLMLALLCQVHVLNNLREEQRPDLLFLNSYLIAVITGYITVDVSFAFTFLLYAPLFIVGLQLQNLDRYPLDQQAEALRAVRWDSIRRSGLLVSVTLLAFFFFPRDFSRPALLSGYFDLEGGGSSYEVGFSQTLELGGVDQQVAQSDRPVLTVEVLEGDPDTLPRLWRGATLSVHSRAGSWGVREEDLPSSSIACDPIWDRRWEGLRLARADGAEAWSPADEQPMTRIRVTRMGGVEQRLFLPREAFAVELDPIHTAGVLTVATDGTARYSNPGELRYEARLGQEPRVPMRRAPTSFELEPFVHQARSLHTQSARTLARELMKRLPEGPAPLEVTREFATYLASRYPYQVPGAEGAARTLDEFLGSEAGGHCEMFASALATMLRSQGVPARVVSGYALSPLQPGKRTLTIRSRDAHAWVEVFSWADGGWFTIDPTPQLDGASGGGGWMSHTLAALEEQWATLTGFDSGSRSDVLRSLLALPGALIRRAESELGGLAAVTALLILLAIQRRRTRPGPPASVRALSREFERAGMPLEPQETPREAFKRAMDADLAPQQLAAIGQAVEQHERARYAGRELARSAS